MNSVEQSEQIRELKERVELLERFIQERLGVQFFASPEEEAEWKTLSLAEKFGRYYAKKLNL